MNNEVQTCTNIAFTGASIYSIWFLYTMIYIFYTCISISYIYLHISMYKHPLLTKVPLLISALCAFLRYVKMQGILCDHSACPDAVKSWRAYFQMLSLGIFGGIASYAFLITCTFSLVFTIEQKVNITAVTNPKPNSMNRDISTL